MHKYDPRNTWRLITSTPKRKPSACSITPDAFTQHCATMFDLEVTAICPPQATTTLEDSLFSPTTVVAALNHAYKANKSSNNSPLHT